MLEGKGLELGEAADDSGVMGSQAVPIGARLPDLRSPEGYLQPVDVQPRAIEAGGRARRDPVYGARLGQSQNLAQSMDDDVQRSVADVGVYEGNDVPGGHVQVAGPLEDGQDWSNL